MQNFLSKILMTNRFALLVSLLLSAASVTYAVENSDVLSKLQQARPDFKFEAVRKTPIKGIYQTNIVGGPAIYITEDGKHFFSGDFFEVGDSGIINLAEVALESERKQSLEKIKQQDMVIFSPEQGTKKHVYVFTDVDCYYCQKLHREIDEINALGIEVRYLAYPRAGIGSKSYRDMASAWCAKDPTQALTALKSGEEIAENVCEPNPVAAQYDLGGRLGVKGTPALITQDGKLLPGYVPAKSLAKSLGL